MAAAASETNLEASSKTAYRRPASIQGSMYDSIKLDRKESVSEHVYILEFSSLTGIVSG